MNKYLLFISLLIFGQFVLFSPGQVNGQVISESGIAFKSSEDNAWASITLYAETNNSTTSTQISYNENMHRGLDPGYDAGFLNSNPNFALYSRLVEDNGNDFAVQCLPLDYEDLVIPLGLDAKAGAIVAFSASTQDIPTQYDVVLEDKILDVFTTFYEVDTKYTIQLNADCDGFGRFFIHTSLKSTLGLGDLKLGNAFQIITRPVEKQLLIRGESKVKTRARIYSITGNLVADFELKKALNNSIPFNENAGIYVVQISNEKRTFTQKFFWVK